VWTIRGFTVSAREARDVPCANWRRPPVQGRSVCAPLRTATSLWERARCWTLTLFSWKDGGPLTCFTTWLSCLGNWLCIATYQISAAASRVLFCHDKVKRRDVVVFKWAPHREDVRRSEEKFHSAMKKVSLVLISSSSRHESDKFLFRPLILLRLLPSSSWSSYFSSTRRTVFVGV
jgi:hypothetical protein